MCKSEAETRHGPGSNGAVGRSGKRMVVVVGWLVGCLFVCLLACLLACLLGWLVGWLVGWLQDVSACLIGVPRHFARY